MVYRYRQNNPKKLDFQVRRSQKVPFRQMKSFDNAIPSLVRRYSEINDDNDEIFVEFALRMKRENL